MGRRWWQKEARLIQHQKKLKLKASAAVEQTAAVEINDEVVADAIDELNETLADVADASVEDESPALEDEELSASEEEALEAADVSDEGSGDDVVEETAVPAVTGTFNQNNNAFKKKKRR